jgi:type I restriction enzyme S subunit
MGHAVFVKVSDVAVVFAGGTPSRGNSTFYGGGIPWVKSGEVAGAPITATEETITEIGLKNSSAKWCKAGSSLLAMYGANAGEVGRLAIRATTNQAVLCVEARDPTDQEFLHYTLQTAGRSLVRLTQGSGQPNLNSAIIKSLSIPWPQSATRKRIANALIAVDNIASAMRQMIEVKSEFKKKLMADLLSGRLRFKEFRKEPWVTGQLGEFFRERSETGSQHLPLLAVTKRGIVPRAELQRRDTSSADKSRYKRVYRGDIAYNTMRMWQGVSGLSTDEGIVSPAYTVVVPNGKISGKYAKHLFKLPQVIHSFLRQSQGLVDDTLVLKFPRFSKVVVQFPANSDEQAEIATALDAVNHELDLLHSLVDAYEAKKYAIMRSVLLAQG